MAIKWFENNFMKINPDKFHLLVSGNFKESVSIQIGGGGTYSRKQRGVTFGDNT